MFINSAREAAAMSSPGSLLISGMSPFKIIWLSICSSSFSGRGEAASSAASNAMLWSIEVTTIIVKNDQP